jgi:hypothetical protein
MPISKNTRIWDWKTFFSFLLSSWSACRCLFLLWIKIEFWKLQFCPIELNAFQLEDWLKNSNSCIENSFLSAQFLCPGPRVARWKIFKPKILVWVNFGGSCNGRFWCIWYIFPVLVCSTKKIWQPWCPPPKKVFFYTFSVCLSSTLSAAAVSAKGQSLKAGVPRTQNFLVTVFGALVTPSPQIWKLFYSSHLLLAHTQAQLI